MALIGRILLPGLCGIVLAAPGSAQTVLFEAAGDSNGDGFGASVRRAGDVDGDGVPDLIVGAPLDDDFANDSGSTLVFSGADGSILFTAHGDSQGERLGFAVDGWQDLDGDGRPEVLAGAPLNDAAGQDAGRVVVLSGAGGQVLASLFGPSPGEQLGWSVAGVGDLDGDGIGDLLAGAPFAAPAGQDSGRVYAFSGAGFASIGVFDGNSEDDLFGFAVAGAGDLDGDGLVDLLVGAPFEEVGGQERGVVRAFSGADGSEILRLEGITLRERFGAAVASAGDLDGDGRPEVFVGAPFADDGRGAARLFSGADGSLLLSFQGAGPSDRFGRSVAGGSDVDGDGIPDLIVGADEDDAAGTNAGSIQVFSSGDGSLLFYVPGDPGTYLGHAVDLVGDWNGDGRSEFAGGAHRGEGNRGSVIVLAAADCPTPTPYCTAAPNSAGAGASIGNAGSTSVSANDFVLTVDAGPPGQSGLFFYGGSQQEAPFGDGFLCVAGQIFRLEPPVQLDANGSAARPIDFGAPPACCGSGAILPGSTWNFQFWYRDPAAAGAGFNLSGALAVPFCD